MENAFAIFVSGVALGLVALLYIGGSTAGGIDANLAKGVAPTRVTFISVNDVYKLVSLPNELGYFYMSEDVAYIENVTTHSCDGSTCDGSDLSQCGKGAMWEACFPLNFEVAKVLSMKSSAHDGPRAIRGPCNLGAQGGSSASWVSSGTGAETFGGLVDFAATYRWLKDEASAKGDLAIGTFAGDFIGPSYLAEIFKGKQLVEIMNHMGVDLVDIGNHDIDFGLKTLMSQMELSAFHYLNSNLEGADGTEIQQPMVTRTDVKGNDFTHQASEWRQLEAYGPGWAMLNKSGVKVCVLGTTDVDKMNWKGKKVNGSERDIPASIAIMKKWEEQQLGCTLKIAMTHTRTGNDINLFRAVEASGLHLDAIIGGHDHYAAFAEMKRKDGGVTFMVKTGADARIVSKLTFELSGDRPIGSLELVPVVAGTCQKHALEGKRQQWFTRTQDLFNTYAKMADETNRIPLNVLYKGVYDTSIVRDAESRAVNMWLDLMRESLSGDLLFFQAGLVRQDMYQNFGGGSGKGMELSKLFMLEEFPWGDEDGDARSSLFPFRVSITDLVMTTVPFLARKYWCSAPFNDANRIHMSGLIIEMVNVKGCQTLSTEELVRSITFVGNCHRKGALQAWDSGCCTAPACGHLWGSGKWDPRVTEEMKATELLVITGQLCVPSKYGSHGPGFHQVGMLCKGAEKAENWGSGSDFSKEFGGIGVVGVDESYSQHAASDFQRHGYLFKRVLLDMLEGKSQSLLVGGEGIGECKQAQHLYTARSFTNACACELGLPEATGCVKTAKAAGSNGFPRFYAAPDEAFARVLATSEL